MALVPDIASLEGHLEELPLHNASAITNDSSASGASVMDALNSIYAGIQRWTVRAVAGNDSFADTDVVLLVSTAAARTITLPAHSAGRFCIIIDSTGQAQTNNITLARASGGNIEGLAASRILQTNWGQWVYISNGTDWFRLA